MSATPSCTVTTRIHADMERVWDLLTRPEDWPGLVDSVRRVERHSFDGVDAETEWEVDVGPSVLWWEGEEHYDVANRTVRFSSVDGDLAMLEGTWHLTEDQDGVQLALHAEFEVGIPGLEDRVNPVAEQLMERWLAELGGSLNQAMAVMA